MILKFLAFCLIFASSCVSAKIIEIDALAQSENELASLSHDSLVLFDVDLTLIIPKDAILQPCGSNFKNRILYRLQLDESDFSELVSRVLSTMKYTLLEENAPNFVTNLQKRGIPTIAFTAAETGRLGIIDNYSSWRVNELKEFGFDFSRMFSHYPFLEFPKEEYMSHFPAYNSGVLFSSSHPKGPVLKQFLDAIEWYPNKVVFFDDRLDFLESVEEVLNEIDIEFTGFHYTASELFPCKLNKELAIFQVKYLFENWTWLSDDEAHEIMSTKDNNDNE